MIENKEGSQNLIKLNIDELIKPDGPERLSVTEKSNENKEYSEISKPEFSSINNLGIKLDEEENNNIDSHSNNLINTPVSQTKQNCKSSQKKAKNRRSRLAIDPEEDNCTQHPKKVYTEEEKIKKAIENSINFNSYLINNRNALNMLFLKRKIEQNYEREDKSQIFFNVPFFPKEDMFLGGQLIKNNGFLYNMNRNSQYNMQNKVGIIQSRNINYQNGLRYINNINNNINNIHNNAIKTNNNVNINNINNNSIKKNSNINLGNNSSNKPNSNINLGVNNKSIKINSNINLGTNNNKNNINNKTNNNNMTNNNSNINNVNQTNKIINNQMDKNNNSSSNDIVANNSNNNISINTTSNPLKPILDTSLLNNSNINHNNLLSINKTEGTTVKKSLLFALKTSNYINNSINNKANSNNEKDAINDNNKNKNINRNNNEELNKNEGKELDKNKKEENKNENQELEKKKEDLENKNNIKTAKPIRVIDLGVKKNIKEKNDKDKQENKNGNHESIQKLYNVIKD